MKAILFSAVAVALIQPMTCAWAQAPAAESVPPTKIALIDMAYVFKKYKRFEVLRNDLKSEIDDADAQSRELAAGVDRLKAELKQLESEKGGPEYVEKEKEVRVETRRLQDFRKDSRRGFLRKESVIYRTIYLESVDAIKEHAEANDYTLVVRFSRDSAAEETDPEKVVKSLNRLVIYSRARDDISERVLKSLNDKYESLTRNRDKSGSPTEVAANRPD